MQPVKKLTLSARFPWQSSRHWKLAKLNLEIPVRIRIKLNVRKLFMWHPVRYMDALWKSNLGRDVAEIFCFRAWNKRIKVNLLTNHWHKYLFKFYSKHNRAISMDVVSLFLLLTFETVTCLLRIFWKFQKNFYGCKFGWLLFNISDLKTLFTFKKNSGQEF